MASSYLEPVSNRRRAVSVALTVAIHIALILLLLNLAPRQQPLPPSDQGPSTFALTPDAATVTETRRRTVARRSRASPRPAPTTPPPPPPVPSPWPDMIRLTRDQFAATDLAKLPRTAPRDTAGEDDGADDTTDTAATKSAGDGPGGARLYRAEWYREPTSAELNTYLPPAAAGSWGMIACRTIPDNRVDDCRTLGESPRGSGLATGMRRAAWQFRVRPPRVERKPLIGAWVSIRIDFTASGAEVRR